MAVDIASSPFHETSAFEDDWQKAVNHNDPNLGGLDLIADFNASCDSNTNAFDDNATTDNGIDPQLLSSTPAASPGQSADIFDDPFGGNGDEFAYPDYNQPAPVNTPYFHSVAEKPCAPPVAPMFASPLRNQLHRRSVSEPPEGALHHHQPPPSSYFIPSGPPMTLTRSGHFLGQPKPQHSSQRGVKGAGRNKPMRGQPYAVKNAHYQPPQPHHRFNMRRSKTQPLHMRNAPPTSMPHGIGNATSPPPLPPQPPVHAYPHPHSRVCTPAPSPHHQNTIAASPPIDPMLQQSMPPVNKVVSIPVDELRGMITEAVRKAVEGIDAAKKQERSEMIGDSEGGAADEDKIVVASVEDRGDGI